MPYNEGAIDRVVRVVCGLALLVFYFGHHESYWALVGIVPLATGLAGVCPLYRLFGVSTCPAKP